MKQLNKQIFAIFITIYSLFWVAFLGKILLDLTQTPKTTSQSNIPLLASENLKQVTEKLNSRAKLEYPEKIDLTKINFGKIEPFNQ